MEHYNALSPYLKNRFGCKICKLSLSAGCTCPNRDGTLGTRGCMFCSGSGEFAASGLASIPEQLEQAKLILGKKAHNARFIAYFQEFTNTYGDVSRLEPLFLQAMEPDDVVALSIATRPDCYRPGVRHSATAEILTQQITENVSHILCTSLLFCNKPM